MASLRILLVLTLSIVSNAQYFFPAIPFITNARDPDPVRGSSSFAIQYEESNNNSPKNTQEIILNKPAGDPNLPARLSYTMTWTLTPDIVASQSDDVRLNVTTKTLGRGTVLIDVDTALPGTAADAMAVTGTFMGSETVRLGAQFVISLNATDSLTTVTSGTFSGNLDYTVAVLDDAKTPGGLWFFGILLSALATVTGVVVYNEKES